MFCYRQHLLHLVNPRLLAVLRETLDGFFMLLQLLVLWYFLPVLGIHTFVLEDFDLAFFLDFFLVFFFFLSFITFSADLLSGSASSSSSQQMFKNSLSVTCLGISSSTFRSGTGKSRSITEPEVIRLLPLKLKSITPNKTGAIKYFILFITFPLTDFINGFPTPDNPIVAWMKS